MWSSIAGADVWKTQWTAMALALSGFIIPFSFAYDPALLLLNASVPHIVLRTAAVTLGILMLGAGLIGYLRVPTWCCWAMDRKALSASSRGPPSRGRP